MGIGSWLSGLFGGSKAEATPSCVACESKDLEMLAPQAYRCNGCGYEGGEGWATLQQARKLSRLEALPLADLSVRVAADLEDLRLLLLTAVEPEDDEPGVRFSVSFEGGGMDGMPDPEVEARRERAAAYERGQQELLQLEPVLRLLVSKGADLQEELDALPAQQKVPLDDADDVVEYITELRAALLDDE